MTTMLTALLLIMSSLLTNDELNSLESLLPYATAQELQRLKELLPLPIADLSKMPIKATAKQAEFLALTVPEALYGGAAGGGKSETLLMWLAEGIHLPDYSAIIFRRTSKQLHKSNDSLVAKSRRLYGPLGGSLNKTLLQWTFPSGALIELGSMEHEDDVENYQGNSFHRIAFDELTHFTEDQYEYLVKLRMRKAPGYPVSLGARAGSNPGGIGHQWVKERFVPQAAIDAVKLLSVRDPSPPGMIFQAAAGRAFIPARVIDNPYTDFEDYVGRMSEVKNVVLRERMMNGDWSVHEGAIIQSAWLRYFDMRGQIYKLYDFHGNLLAECDERDCRRFATIDTAGTSDDKAKEKRGKPPSWSVMAVWDSLPRKFGTKLILRHVWRERVGLPDLLDGIKKTHAEWKPKRIRIEDKHFGPGVADMLKPVMPISTIACGQKDKLERADDFLLMLKQGEIFLPKYDNGWRPKLEAEWLAWTGHPDEQADQIDVSSYAAWEAKQHIATWDGPVRIQRQSRIGV